ncbi:DUF72 domain-containing protein [Pleomorphomonas carboxyditropha]|uniref:DUF72 domain-containing protein n=1 Tax=Pleomorphomonas carboxyditropha TaxID=2023338 RepID=A0A2G9X1M0_9HYPH|nr:DUF72 domain-containing protein [Pleomorphomonas carboxyditropha]PIP00453.1 hypothetical protein CJ014_06910 [Pleomorphomonas carboxyditropha]
MQSRVGVIRIGISGWTYAPWRGRFYPKGLRQSRELAYAASRFSSLEINGTFYGLQKPRVFDRWASETPADFIFAVKGPRFITHVKRLRDIEAPLANFFASGPLRLGEKLGPVLWQFPPSFPFDVERLRDFLALLPRNTEAAADLAREHDDHISHPDETRPAKQPIRYALEIRHASFRDPAFIELLREQDVALVCADTVEWPRLMDVTSDFVYCRLHGSRELYRSGYDDAERHRWARRIAAWSRGEPMDDGNFVGARKAPDRPRDVFLFFDNTDGFHAPDDALAIMRELGVEWRHDADAPAA